MTDQQSVMQGTNSAQLLDNPVYQDAMRRMRDEVVHEWKTCPIRDKEGQLLLLQLAKLTDKFEGILRGYIENGKLAQRKIDLENLRDESKPKKLLRRVGL